MWRAASLAVSLAGIAGCSRAPAERQAEASQPEARQAEARAQARAQAAFDRYRRPELLVAGLGITDGARVADVGAGAGYLTHRLARAAGPRGRVVATDVDGAALARIGAAAEGEAPIETRRVRADEPGLEPAAYDRVLLSEVDHLLPDRAQYLGKLRAALRPGGRIAVVNRRHFRAALLSAAARAGLSVVEERSELPAHFLVLLEAR